ncbi:MAG: sel1 repeat family protein, partial [Synergistaceae bacterium]|nr:sel1 repeat family protein [Synergistaceae bacterium]
MRKTLIFGLTAALQLTFLIFGRAPAGAETAPYDPANTLCALNMAIASVHRITAAADRIVLDQEYKNIINNLNLGNIEDDGELKELYKDLLEVIGNKTLRQEEAERVTAEHDKREKNRFVNLLSGARAIGGNPWIFIGGLLANEVTAYFGAPQTAESGGGETGGARWKMERENIEDCAALQKRLLDSSWTLLRRYNLPDEYRLTQSDLDDFDKAVRESDAGKKIRMFRALEPNFKTYAPFWYYYAESALAAGDGNTSRRCFAEFDRVWRPVLRQDPFKAEMAKYRARELADNGAPKKEITAQLEMIMENTPRENWINNLFAGVMYYSAGETQKGMECVSINVDFGAESEISGEVLKDMKDGSLDASLFSDKIQSMIISRQRGYSDARENSGAETERGLIAWFRNDPAAAARLMKDAISNAAGAADPAPYHALLDMIESMPGKRAAEARVELPDGNWLRKELGETIGTAPETAYAALVPLVERYAAEGSGNAKIFLGDMYMKGLGVSADVKKAAELFTGPAKEGVAYAQGMLGVISEAQDGFKDETVRYYREAAEQGLSWAALRLGDLYRDGGGSAAKNLEDAYMWYWLAALNGDTDA